MMDEWRGLSNNRKIATRHNPHRMPLFFKLWFGFIATIILAILGTMIYLAVSLVQAGPEGVGQTIGSVVRGFNDAVDRR